MFSLKVIITGALSEIPFALLVGLVLMMVSGFIVVDVTVVKS